MKAIYATRIFIIATLILVSSCGGDKETREETESPRIRKFSKISQPTSNQSFKLNTPIEFGITSSEVIDSISIEFENESKTFNNQKFKWSPTQARTGKQKFRLTVYSGKNTETHYARVVFLSDLKPAEYAYQVLGEYDHSEESFVQGFFFIGDTLVESTGQNGTSKLFKYNYETGAIYQSVSLDRAYFGEGSTFWGNKIYYLTWEAQIGFIYNRKLEQTGQFNYAHEGWGMTTMGDTLVISDGGEELHLLDPRDMTEIGKLQVYDDEGAVTSLNELEYINGIIYANIWMEDLIIGIDSKTGKVLHQISLEGLRSRFQSNDAEVLNGIAYKQNSDQIFVTGKNWPKTYEVKFAPIN